MSTRLYFMPAVTEIRNGRLTKHPKYDTLWVGAAGQFMDFGSEPFFFVAVDLTDTQHTTVAVNSDVITIPVSALDSAMTGAWTTVINPRLELVQIPSDWIVANQTHRFALAVIIRMFLFLQSLQGQMGSSLFTAGITLDTAWNALPHDIQVAITNAATVLSMDTSWVTNQTTVRQLMKGFADRWSGGPIHVLDVVL